MPHPSSPVLPSNLTDEELLEHYLSLSPNRRGESFIDTAHAAEITGVSVRTIQLWIESGAVRAIAVGGKYRVVRDSLKAHLREKMNKRES
jgi:excisionase family DNA binding protein